MSVYQINISNNEYCCNLITKDLNVVQLRDLCLCFINSKNLINEVNRLIKDGFVLLTPNTQGRTLNLVCGIRRYTIKDKYGKSLVNDSFGSFFDDVTLLNNNEYEQYIGKVVSFKYKGGSSPNKKRIVKVESADDTHLRGKDVEKDEPRNYLVSNIDKSTLTILSE